MKKAKKADKDVEKGNESNEKEEGSCLQNLSVNGSVLGRTLHFELLKIRSDWFLTQYSFDELWFLLADLFGVH